MPSISGAADAMSDVLALVRMRGEVVCACEMGAPWGLGFARPAAHFHIVESGVAWLRVGTEAPIRLEAGDLAILPLGAGHVLTSDPAGDAIPLEEALAKATARAGAAYRLGADGAPTQLVCGRFSFAGVLAPKLLQVLPPLIHIEGRRGRPLEWLRLTSQFLVEETRNPQPGSAIMIHRLLDLLFIQAIRHWGARNPRTLGWLSGLGDPQVGRALSVIHDAPAERWTVETLAETAGLSRSAFAVRFADAVGQTPLKYLSAWRLDLAADQLKSGSTKIAQIAVMVGYGSEAALSRAFKTQFGVTPAAFRRQS